MGLGLGVLTWSPEVFWKSTLLELNAASRGLAIYNGNEQEDKSEPLDREGFEALKEKLNA